MFDMATQLQFSLHLSLGIVPNPVIIQGTVWVSAIFYLGLLFRYLAPTGTCTLSPRFAYTGPARDGSVCVLCRRITEVRHWVDKSTMAHPTSGATGSDLESHFEVKYRQYTQKSAFWKANRTRRTNDLQGPSQGHGANFRLLWNFGLDIQKSQKQWKFGDRVLFWRFRWFWARTWTALPASSTLGPAIPRGVSVARPSRLRLRWV